MLNPFESLEARLTNIENLLHDIKQSAGLNNVVSESQSGDLMTVHQCAEFLTLAVPTIYSMVSRGDLPYMKRSKRIYFSRSELVEYLKEGRKHTTSEILDSGEKFMLKRNRKK